MRLEAGDEIETEADSTAVIRFANGTEVFVGQSTRVRIGSLWVLFGEIYVRARGAFRVETRYVTAGVEGTEYLLTVDSEAQMSMVVLDGIVRLTSKTGSWQSVALTKLDQGVFRLQERPLLSRVDPVDASRIVQAINQPVPRILAPTSLATGPPLPPAAVGTGVATTPLLPPAATGSGGGTTPLVAPPAAGVATTPRPPAAGGGGVVRSPRPPDTGVGLKPPRPPDTGVPRSSGPKVLSSPAPRSPAVLQPSPRVLKPPSSRPPVIFKPLPGTTLQRTAPVLQQPPARPALELAPPSLR
jgi:hypothetical protein